ncbi:MAG: hypothetical protein ACHQ0I_04445 [Candidatus Lutacidiplasmatales archaeon]
MSAVGNALTLTSPLPPAGLLRALNGTAPDIFFTAATVVPESFRVRGATRRVYRYFQPDGSYDLRKWEDVAQRFSGRIDVRSFGRSVPAEAPVWRTIDLVTVTPRPGGALIEIRAPSFVWGMVRKIVAAFREIDAGRLSLDRLETALRGGARLTLPLVEPEPLVLWDVEYPFPWQYRWRGPSRHRLAWEKSAWANLWVRRELLAAFSQGTQS